MAFLVIVDGDVVIKRNAGGSITDNWKVLLLDWPVVSVTSTVYVVALLFCDGVPNICPVIVLNDSPVGNVALAVLPAFLSVYVNVVFPPVAVTGAIGLTFLPLVNTNDAYATVVTIAIALGSLIIKLNALVCV